MKLVILAVMMCCNSCNLTPKVIIWDQLRSPCLNDNGGMASTSIHANIEFCRPGHGIIIGASKKL